MARLDDIMLFLAIARAGTLSAAADHLRLDVATLSRRIRRLEADLGTTLFAKSPRGYVPTADGEALRARAEGAEALLAGIETELGGRAQRLSGRIRIGAPEGCAVFLLAPVTAAIAAAHPDLDIEIVVSSREFDLLNREVDLAISVVPARAKAILSTPLAEYELHLAGSHSHVDKLPTSFRVQDAAQIAYIEELLVDDGLALPSALAGKTTRLRSNSVNVQWEWIRQGHGIGLVHDFILRDAPGVVRIMPDFAVRRTYFLCLRRDEAAHGRMRLMAEALASGFAARLPVQAAPASRAPR